MVRANRVPSASTLTARVRPPKSSVLAVEHWREKARRSASVRSGISVMDFRTSLPAASGSEVVLVARTGAVGGAGLRGGEDFFLDVSFFAMGWMMKRRSSLDKRKARAPEKASREMASMDQGAT